MGLPLPLTASTLPCQEVSSARGRAGQVERLANHDPRLSLEERYRNRDGYVVAVRNAAARAVKEGFLLQADADALIKQAAASNVLAP